ncbi:hypothetical protein [Mesorhizobium sp.]|uniref:hypothetical protein n=1 Tax=Mesorhizobium sp. TaxID=1871066 RepID=UPI003BAAC454
MSDLELEEMEARAAAAQPGPCKSQIKGGDFLGGSNFIQTDEGSERGEDIEMSGATAADQDFTAAAHRNIPRLIAEVRRLAHFPIQPNRSRRLTAYPNHFS